MPVVGPTLELTGSDDPVEVCGDGDANLERGEVWRFPARITNTGDAPAVDAVAGFAVAGAAAASKRLAGPDAFGYAARDSAEGFCAFQELDISATGTLLEPDDSDDGGVEVELADGQPFDFYGAPLSRVTMSTNGYLAADPDDDGGDFSNDCPLPRPLGGDARRIAPLHDDLVLEGGLFHQHFDACPRPQGAGTEVQPCDVFQWEDMRYFSVTGDRFDFQAILYRESFDLVFQYGPGDPRRGDRSTTGIQNAGGDVGLTYACNERDTLAPNAAVCIFHPDSNAPSQSDRAELLTPAVELGTVAVGESIDIGVDFRILDDFPCGGFVALDYLGAGHAGGFSRTSDKGALMAVVANEPCAADGVCNQLVGPDIAPREGFWLNPLRGGTGMDLHFRAGLYGAWYTAEADGSPIWYYIQPLANQQLENAQINADLLRFMGPVESPNFTVVGDATFSFLDPSRALMTWTLNGEADGELIRFFDLNAAPGVDPDVTDQWFDPEEPGWGYGVQRQGDDQFAAVYFYSVVNEPAWVVTLEPEALFQGGVSSLGAFDSHCPSCAWTTPVFEEQGSIRMEFAGDEGVTDIDVDVTAPGGTRIIWLREDLPLVPIRSLAEPGGVK